MKILLINVTFGIGSTGKIVESLFNYYKSLNHDVYAIYGRKIKAKEECVFRGGFEFESKVHHLVSLITGNLYGGMFFSTKRIVKIIKKIRPDIIHLHSLNGYFVNSYRLLAFLKKNKYKTILTNHSFINLTGNCGYPFDCNKWIKEECKNCERIKSINGKFSLNRTRRYYKKMRNAFTNFNNLLITNVSPWLTSLSTLSPFFKDKSIYTVLNPVDEVFSLPDKHKKNPYDDIVEKNKKIVFYCTASFDNPEKGGYAIFDLAERLRNENIVFVIKSAVRPSKIYDFDNIIFVNKSISTKELSLFYHFADVSLLLSQWETFSMVTAESLCSGTPVVGFKAGGPESISIPEFSSFVEFGNIDLLCNEILLMLSKELNKEKVSIVSTEKFDIKRIGNEYIKIYEK